MEVYGEQALAERTCQKWFARFKNGDVGLEDEERPGRPKIYKLFARAYTLFSYSINSSIIAYVDPKIHFRASPDNLPLNRHAKYYWAAGVGSIAFAVGR